MSDSGRDPEGELAGQERGDQPVRASADLAFGDGGPRLWLATLLGAARVRLALMLEREMEAGHGFLWVPVLFGIGIGAYFVLPREPSAIALGGLAAILVFSATRARHKPAAYRTLVALAAIVCGATATKLRTDLVAAPVIAREMTVKVTGWLAAREEAARGTERLLVRIDTIAGLAAPEAPAIVRVTARGSAVFAVGDGVSFTARLQPPSGPVIPGGYDFARAAFYQGIGAIGFTYGAPKPAAIGPAPLRQRWASPLDRLRQIIRQRIEATLAGDHGHIAVALIVGDQGGISDRTQDAMRASGLGHALSISGLHMALVGGSAFWLIRALLALSTRLALTRPIKKWAAAGGLAVATFYLGISGGSVATERAYVMLAIMLLAILLDRRAITLRNVAVGALIVLAFSPESLLTPGFQMSFAATIALVVGYEAITRYGRARRTMIDPGPAGPLGYFRRAAASLFLTSLIAGLATAPFAVYHFQRLAPLTLIANLAAIPVFGLLVMPMALAAVVLMPFGLESPPLALMDYGIDWFVAVAETTAAWSGAAGGVPMMPAAALLLMVGGFLWLSLWRERWRLAGLVPILAALPIAVLAPRPDVLVDEAGSALAVRGEDGRYRIIGDKAARFEIANWLRADGDPRQPGDPTLTADAACNSLGCVLALGKGGGEVALVNKPDAFAEDCRLAAIVVTRLSAPPGCDDAAIVIDRGALRRFGAHALQRRDALNAAGKPDFTVETAYPAIRRPFMPPAPAAQ